MAYMNGKKNFMITVATKSGTTDFNELQNKPTTETWTFTIQNEDGSTSTVTKAVYVKNREKVTIYIENFQSADDLNAATITHNGITYNDTGSYTIEAFTGDTILCNVNAAVGPPPTLDGKVILNGNEVYSIAYDGADLISGTYPYVVTKDASIYLSNSQYMHYGWCGTINIFDE